MIVTIEHVLCTVYCLPRVSFLQVRPHPSWSAMAIAMNRRSSGGKCHRQ